MCVWGGSSSRTCIRGVRHCWMSVRIGVSPVMLRGMTMYGLDCQFLWCGVTCRRTSSVANAVCACCRVHPTW
eukprot:10387094-Prorocentrum_lima.AAC.1